MHGMRRWCRLRTSYSSWFEELFGGASGNILVVVTFLFLSSVTNYFEWNENAVANAGRMRNLMRTRTKYKNDTPSSYCTSVRLSVASMIACARREWESPYTAVVLLVRPKGGGVWCNIFFPLSHDELCTVHVRATVPGVPFAMPIRQKSSFPLSEPGRGWDPVPNGVNGALANAVHPGDPVPYPCRPFNSPFNNRIGLVRVEFEARGGVWVWIDGRWCLFTLFTLFFREPITSRIKRWWLVTTPWWVVRVSPIRPIIPLLLWCYSHKVWGVKARGAQQRRIIRVQPILG